MLFLGVDAGGSKTVAALADAAGQVVALAEAGRGNFQHSNIINGFKHKRFYAIRSVLHGSLGIAPGGLGFPET